MLPPPELDSLREDTIPQAMEQQPSSDHEVNTVSHSACLASGVSPADASPDCSPDAVTISSACAADVESVAQESRIGGSSAALEGGESTTKEDGGASGTEDERRDGEINYTEAVGSSCQTPEGESSSPEEREESYDIGCMPSELLDEAFTHDKGSAFRPGSPSSIEHPEGRIDDEASAVPPPAGAETDPSAALAFADASAEEGNDGDDHTNRPTDEQLLEAFRDIAAGGEDFETLTPKQIVRMLEARFSCTMQDRKKIIRSALMSVLTALLVEQEQEEVAADEVSNQKQEEAASDNASASASNGEDRGGPGSSTASLSARDSDSDEEEQEEALLSQESSDSDGGSASADATIDNCSRGEKSVSKGSDDESGGSVASSSSDGSGSSDEGSKDLSARTAVPSGRESEENLKDSSASESSSSEAEEAANGAVSPLPPMPRPQARKTSARRALAKAKIKRAVRGARRVIGPSSAARGSDAVSDDKSSSDSGPDSGLGSDGRSGAKAKSSSRPKPKQSRESAEDMSGERAQEDSAEDPLAAAASSSSSAESDGSSFEESLLAEPRGRRRKGGKGKGRAAAAKQGPAGRRKAKKGKTGAVDDDGGSALVNSDDEGLGASKGGGAASPRMAVAQEELDDVSEEKLKERKRIAEERQRLLESLRVMDAAQLKEATRAQQGSLLARIKERQGRVHAALAASAKEELKTLRAEARKAAGVTGEEEAEDEEEEAGGELGCAEIAGGVGGLPRDEVGEGVDRPDKVGDHEMEDIIAKEEVMAAAGCSGENRDELEEEEEEEEEEEDSDFILSRVSDKVAGVNASRPSSASGKGAVDSSKQGGSSESSSGSDSDSDSELEILPAEATNAVQALMRRQAAFSVSKDAASGVGTSAENKKSKNGAAAGSGGIAARALAALPKGMRFSSPIAANKNRATNRRKLAASARTVANDRWAAQLGYQDGQEHIRDLKYMELKRRQQAHHDRERKEKENDAVAARLREYALHADEDEEEFAPGLTADAPPASPAASAGDSGDDLTASRQPTGPHADGATETSPASPSRESVAPTLPEDSPATTPTAEASAGELGADIGQEGDVLANAGKALASEATDHTDMPSPAPTSGTDGQVPAEGADLPSSREENATDAIAPQAEHTAVALVETPAAVAEPTVIPIPVGGGALEAEAGAVGVVQAAAYSPSTEGWPAAGGGGGTTAETAPSAAGVVPVVRPKVVRTYGRKTRGEDGRVVGKLGGGVGEGGSVSAGADIGRGVLSLDSQALWAEEEEEPDWAPSGTPGCDDAMAGEDGSYGLSFGLDVDDDDDDDLDNKGDGAVTKEPSLDATDDVAEQAGGDGCTTAEAGTKRKLGEVQAEDGVEDDAAGECDVVSPLAAPAVSTAGGIAPPPPSKPDDNAPPSSFVKMKLAADGGLEEAPTQPRVSDLFKASAGAGPVSGTAASSPLGPPPSKKGKKPGIAAFFGTATTTTTTDGSTVSTTVGERERGEDAGATTTIAVACDDTATAPPTGTAAVGAPSSVSSSGTATAADTATAKAEVEPREGERGETGESKEQQQAEHGQEGGDDAGNDGDKEEEEASPEPKDRSAKFRAMLEAERAANRQAKKLRKTGMMDDEAEEEEEEEAVRGLGDFGFGVSASGTGTAASGGSKVGGKGDDEDEGDDEIREEDLEGIVDTFSDDEGDKDAQDAFLNNEAAAGDRQELKDMVRRVREGFGEERGGRGRGTNARGNLRMDELTAADRSSRKEARRLGLLNSDEEWSDDEKGDGKEKDDLEELDEQQLGELLAREQRARHMGLSQTAQDYLDSSDSEGEGDNAGSDGEGKEGRAEEEAERLEEARVQKLWVKRAKRRRVLAEVEQSAAGDSQGPESLMQEDEDSQAILSLLQCTNSRLTYSGSIGGGGGGGGDASMGATATTADTAVGKRRVRDQFSGELDAREVANGFGMGMSSKPLKRAKSDGTEPKDVTTAEARARMDRAFTMPQFVTSVAGYGGSSRAKQIQRKGSFLSRSGSLQARSGSLASGKTTVSASKFVFMSSSSGSSNNSGGGGIAPTHDEDTCARTGFEEPAARDSSSSNAGINGSKKGGGWSTSRAPLSASGANVGQRSSKVGAFSGIGGGKGGVGGGGRLWKGLCASAKQKSTR